MRKNKKGFTLIEIIVVVVILAVLLAIAVPSVLKYMNEADSAKYLSTSRAINDEVSIYVNKRRISDQRENIPFSKTIENLKTELSYNQESIIPEVITTTPPEGYVIRSIDCCFDGVSHIEKPSSSGTSYEGWAYDSSLNTHQMTKIVIWYSHETKYDAKYVVTLVNDKMYFYNSFGEAYKKYGQEEGPFINMS